MATSKPKVGCVQHCMEVSVVLIIVCCGCGGMAVIMNPSTTTPTSNYTLHYDPTFERATQVTMEGVPRFDVTACPIIPAYESLHVGTCGYLVVPEDRSQPNGRTIRLAVMILRRDNFLSSAPDPVIYLHGGPAGSAIGVSYEQFPFLQQRDLILIDQRGAGRSLPAMTCPQVDYSTANYLETCYQQIVKTGINPSAYNTDASAADIEDLRRVLGYDQVNLFGISYGTRLALHIMRTYPQHIRSVVLDSAFPPTAQFYATDTASNQYLLDKLFADCAADAACNAAYPQLEARFYALIEQADAKPMPFRVHIAGKTIDRELSGSSIMYNTLYGLNDARGINYLPLLLNDLAQGDTRFAEVMGIDMYGGSSSGYYNLTYISVQCHDEVPFNPPLEEIYAADEVAYPQMRWSPAIPACDEWQVKAAEPSFREPVQSEIPTLILAGSYDNITPPLWGQETAKTLSHAVYLEFPTGHDVIGTAQWVDSTCPMDIANAFVDNPHLTPNAACIAQINNPNFITDVSDVYASAAYREFMVTVSPLVHRKLFWLLIFCTVMFLLETLLMPLRLVIVMGQALVGLLRHPTAAPVPPVVRLGKVGASLIAMLNLWLIILMVMAVLDSYYRYPLLADLVLPVWTRYVFFLPLMTATLSLLLPIAVVEAWRSKAWDVVQRITFTVQVTPPLVFAGFTFYWFFLALTL